MRGSRRQHAADGGGRLVETGMIWHGELDHVAAHPVFQLFAGAGGDDHAVVDDDDLVGQLIGFIEVLGGEEQGGAPKPPAPG